MSRGVPWRNAILRVVLPYVVFAGLWIFLSDRLLALGEVLQA